MNWTRMDDVRYVARKKLGRLGYLFDLWVEIAAVVILFGALAYGTYAAYHGDLWGGGSWAAGALVVLVAYGKANLRSTLYERSFWQERQRRVELQAGQTIEEE